MEDGQKVKIAFHATSEPGIYPKMNRTKSESDLLSESNRLIYMSSSRNENAISLLSISNLFNESIEPVTIPALPDDSPEFTAEVETLEKKTGVLKHTLKLILLKLNCFVEHRIEEIKNYSEMLELAKLLPHHGMVIEENSGKLEAAVQEANRILISETRDALITPLKEILDETVRPLLEAHKKAFDAEREEYHAFQEKYLGMKVETDAKRKVEQDLKNATKKRAYEQLRYVFG